MEYIKIFFSLFMEMIPISFGGVQFCDGTQLSISDLHVFIYTSCSCLHVS